MNSLLIPENILVEKSVIESQLVRNIKRNLRGCKMHVVDHLDGAQNLEAEESGKVIEVIDFRGQFLKPCPGTRNYICCGYRILHFGEQCSIGCNYCILQAYFSSGRLRLFANWDRMLSEVESILRKNPDRYFRIGTGEFTDSLLLDPVTEFSRLVVPFFARFRNSILELKTKTDHIDNLKKLDHGGRTIVAWSMNSPAVAAKYEGLAVPLEKRIECAKLCLKWGYRVAFHFDPMIFYDGWEKDYRKAVDLIFKNISPEKIVWISLGCFRFMPPLKGIIEKRYRNAELIYGEFISGIDGKMRYFKDIRITMYKKMVKWIHEYNPEVCVYLCMESPEIWKAAFGFNPLEKGGLPAILDLAAKSKCGD